MTKHVDFEIDGFVLINQNVESAKNEDNVIDVNDVNFKMVNIITKLYNSGYINNVNVLNIISSNECNSVFLTNFINILNELYPDVKFSISNMNNYKITHISENFNFHGNCVILHNGIEFSLTDMLLRIFTTMAYKNTSYKFITLFDSDESDYSLVDYKCNDYHGYGKFNKKYNKYDAKKIYIE